MLTCKNLTLEYINAGKTNVILQDINLTVNKGEKIVLLGPSGSGKSSLIYLLSSLKKPVGGEVVFNDISLTSQNENENTNIRKKHFGFIFQTHFLLPYLTVLENVLVIKNAFTEENKQKAASLLKQLGLAEHTDKKIYQLSGGERQRVAIARALTSEPDILFADEPTASLDHETAAEVVSILKSYKQASTLIMATHDTSVLSGDETVYQLNSGKINIKY